MSTVYLLPENSDSAPAAAAGDFLVRPSGDDVEVGRTDGSSVQWLSKVPRTQLPDLPAVDAPQEAPDQTRLLIAVEGIETAEDTRGG